MRSAHRALKVAAVAAVVGMSSYANAALVSQFDSPAAYNAGDTVTALVGPNGKALGPITLASDPAHSDNYGVGAGDAGGSATTGWDTQTPISSLTDSQGTFTAIAIVKAADTSGDNMVFGATGGNPLHLGFRGNQAWFGFWGNDSHDNAGSLVAGETAVWAWRYNFADKSQQIFKNGVALVMAHDGTPPNPVHGAYANGGNLLLGTTGANGGNFNGGLDDVRFYNSALTDGEISTLSTQMAAADVPEPGVVGALVGMGSLMFARRRRR